MKRRIFGIMLALLMTVQMLPVQYAMADDTVPQGTDEETSAVCICQDSHVESCEVCIANIADCEYQATAVCICQNGHVDTCEVCLANPADCEYQEPAVCICENGHVDTCEVCIANIADCEYQEPAVCICQDGHVDTCEVCIANIADCAYQAPAVCICQDGHVDTCEVCIANPADCEYQEPAAQIDLNDVAKIGDQGYETLQAAIDAATAGQTVTLLADITIDAVDDMPETHALVMGDDDVIIDLDGHTVTGAFYINSGGKATIQDGFIVNTSMVSGIESKGDLTLTNMSITSNRHGVRISAGTVTFNSGTYKTVGSADTRHAVNASGGSVVTIVDGTFIGAGEANNGGEGNCLMLNGASANISGGTFTGSNGVEGAISPDDGLVISGGTFCTWSYDSYLVSGKAAKKISEGEYQVVDAVALITETGKYYASLNSALEAAAANQTVTLLQSAALDSQFVVSKNLTLNLDAFNITGTGSTPLFLVKGATLEIKGSGSITAGVPLALDSDDDAAKLSKDAAVTVEAPEDYIWKDNTSLIKGAAKVDGLAYATVQEAIDAAGTTAVTVTILKNVTENVTVAEGQNITLDLAGFTLSGGTAADAAAITNNGTVTITGNGTVKREDKGTPAYYVISNDGTMTILNGNFTNDSGSDDKWGGASLISNGTNKAATLTIKGGTFSQDSFIIIKNNDYGVLNFENGTISGGAEAPPDNVVSGIQNWNVANISGGNIDAAVMTAIYNDGPASVTTISGGNISNDIIVTHSGTVTGKLPTVEIEGGSITGNLVLRNNCAADITKAESVTLAAPDGYWWDNGELSPDITVKVNGSDVSGDPTELVAAAASASKPVITMPGDTINGSLIEAAQLNGEISIVVTSNGATATFDKDAIEAMAADDVTLKITNITATETYGAPEGAYVYEIEFVDSKNNPVDFSGGNVEVVLAAPAGADDTWTVYYYNGKGGKQDMNATVENGEARFTTGHFSGYSVEPRNTTGYAASVDGTMYADFDDALDAWKANGGTLKLLQDINTINEKATCIHITKASTLDLNGFEYRARANGSCSVGGSTTHFIRVTDGAVFNITDTSASKDGILSYTYLASSNALMIDVVNGTVNLDAGTLTNEASLNYGGSLVYLRNSSVFNMNGGVLNASKPSNSYSVAPIWVLKSTTANLSNATVITTSREIVNSGTINATNSVITGTALSGTWNLGGQVSVNDGSSITITPTAPADFVASRLAKDATSTIYYTEPGAAASVVKGASSGDFIVIRENAATTTEAKSKGFTVTIKPEKGASLDGIVITPGAYCETLTTVNDDHSTTFTVAATETSAMTKAETAGGELSYHVSISAAARAAGSGGKVTLLKDVTGLTSTQSLYYPITLDLNGHDIEVAKGHATAFNGAIEIDSTSDTYGDISATIIDSVGGGSVTNTKNTATEKGYSLYVGGRAGHKLTVTGGSYNGPVAVTAGTLEIINGTFTGSITVTGGKLEISGGTFSVEPDSAYIKEGYSCIEENGLFKVIKNSYTVAFNAKGGTGTMANQSFTYGVEQKLRKNAFTRAGYIFDGWDTDVSADAVVYDDEEEVENLTSVNGETVTLYAVWKAKPALNPTLTTQSRTYTGLAASYELAGGYTITYEQDSKLVTPVNAGSYDVIITRAEDDTNAAYSRKLENGLIINKAVLTATYPGETITYGETPELKVVLTGFVNNETEAVLTSKPIVTAKTNEPGIQDLMPTGGAAANYSFRFVSGKLTIEYAITWGAGQTVTRGNSATFISNAEREKFTGVMVDGEYISTSKYTIASDSTKVTLKADYIKSLRLGRHTLTIVSGDNSASTEFKVKYANIIYDSDAYGTGDITKTALWLAIALVGSLGIVASRVGKKRLTKRK